KNITILLSVLLQRSADRKDQVIVGKPWYPDSMVYPYYQYGVEFTNRTRKLDFYFGDASGRMRGPFGLTPRIGGWTRAAFTYDGSFVRGYVDGQPQLGRRPGDPVKLSDLAANLLLFAPFGFGFARLIRERGSSPLVSILSALLVGSLLSLTV